MEFVLIVGYLPINFLGTELAGTLRKQNKLHNKTVQTQCWPKKRKKEKVNRKSMKYEVGVIVLEGIGYSDPIFGVNLKI